MKKTKYILLFLCSTTIVVGIGSIILAKYVLPYAIIQPPRISENISPSDIGLSSINIHVLTKDSVELK